MVPKLTLDLNLQETNAIVLYTIVQASKSFEKLVNALLKQVHVEPLSESE